jgi:hypothetical protein
LVVLFGFSLWLLGLVRPPDLPIIGAVLGRKNITIRYRKKPQNFSWGSHTETFDDS